MIFGINKINFNFKNEMKNRAIKKANRSNEIEPIDKKSKDEDQKDNKKKNNDNKKDSKEAEVDNPKYNKYEKIEKDKPGKFIDASK